MSIKATFGLKAIRDGIGRMSFAPGAHRTITTLAALQITGDIEGISMKRNTTASRIIAKVDAEVEEDGIVYVSHEAINDAVKGFIAEKVTIFEENGYLVLECGRGRRRVKTIAADQCSPDYEMTGESSFFDLDIIELIEAIRSVTPAVAINSTDALENLSFRTDSEATLFIAGADRRKLFTRNFPDTMAEVDFMFPSEVAKAIPRIFESLEGSVTIECFENGVSITHPNVSAFVGITEGKFIDYFSPLLGIVGQADVAAFKCNRKAMIEAVKAASVYMFADTMSVILRFKKGIMEIVGANSENEATEPVDAVCTEGADHLEVVAAFLIEWLSLFRGDEIDARVKGQPPCIIAEEGDRSGFVALLNKKPKAEKK